MKINIPSNNDIKVGFIKEFLVFPADEEILLTSGTIDLSYNLLGESGTKYIYEWLKLNKKLTKFYNDINDDSIIKSKKESLKTNTEKKTKFIFL